MVPFTIRTRIETDFTGQLDRRCLSHLPMLRDHGRASIPSLTMRRARVGRVALTELSEEARQRPDAHHGRTRGTLARGAKDTGCYRLPTAASARDDAGAAASTASASPAGPQFRRIPTPTDLRHRWATARRSSA